MYICTNAIMWYVRARARAITKCTSTQTKMRKTPSAMRSFQIKSIIIIAKAVNCKQKMRKIKPQKPYFAFLVHCFCFANVLLRVVVLRRFASPLAASLFMILIDSY